MATPRRWAPDRRDMNWIDFNPQAGREMRDVHALLVLSPKAFNERTGIVIGLPMTTASYNESNPFAVRFEGPKGEVSYVLGHQPKFFNWRVRKAKLHPWKQVSAAVLMTACETLSQIVLIGA